MRFSVCLVVIARNEAPRIRRLLDSVRPWVDRMLVVDTGSIDDTAHRATLSGAEVRHFPWCDDFAAARNAALAAAGADWHLVLDADEWLVEGGESLGELRRTAPSFVGTLEVASSFDTPQGIQSGVVRLSRILPGAVRYEGRVHEQPRHSLAVRALKIRVAHDGYREERLAVKRGRNEMLLRRMLQESPSDAYLWYQLGKELDVYEQHADAEAAFAEAERWASGKEGWWMDLAPRRIFGLKRLGAHAAAIDWAFGQLERCGGSADFHFALGDLLLDAAATVPAQAGELLPLAEVCWRECLRIGEQSSDFSVAGRGSHLAAHNLAVLLEGTDRAAEAAALRGKYAGA